ncbi:MAG: acetyl/propionyl/methylcrotonyl-CoA carboxylase subunit alpha [Nevskiales bacterium]
MKGFRFTKVLIANRGEIAVRVIRGCKKLGYATVAVYSDADRDAAHVWAADEAVRIGPAPAKESYLVIQNLIAAAKQSGAQAVHPGYGFLSEREDFAQAVQDAGLVFIGPDPASIEAMGNKSASKIRMLEAKVPCVPGYQGEDQTDALLVKEAKKIGLPVMIKAAAGGGGRGMRLVHDEKNLLASIQSARSEAANAFGDGQLLIEKAVIDARHVEIQIFGDRHGNVIHLGERDCSIQRRNQKVVEEAPSPAVDDALRRKMGEAAVAAAKAVSYVGAGTVEFMLARDKQFYFLEMNTRLQVEHPVTEFVYGIDLVEWQLRVAQGEKLPLSQDEVLARRKGHAIEVRLCAEDATNNFMPQTGQVLVWHVPTGDGMRVDHSLKNGQEISPFYDSMQAKLIAFGATREQARRKLLKMLRDTVLLGVTSNRDFLARVAAHDAFAGGDFSTGFIAKYFPPEVVQETEQPSLWHKALAAALAYQTDALALQQQSGFDAGMLSWRSANPIAVPMKLRCGKEEFTAQVLAGPSGTFEVRLQHAGGAELQHLGITAVAGHEVHYVCEAVQGKAFFARRDAGLWLVSANETHAYTDATYEAVKPAEAGGDGRVLAQMDGKIVSVHVKPGDTVEKGQTVLVLEAMKMEFQIAAGVAGKIAAVSVTPGTQVSLRQVLATIEPGV